MGRPMGEREKGTDDDGVERGCLNGGEREREREREREGGVKETTTRPGTHNDDDTTLLH